MKQSINKQTISNVILILRGTAALLVRERDNIGDFKNLNGKDALFPDFFIRPWSVFRAVHFLSEFNLNILL